MNLCRNIKKTGVTNSGTVYGASRVGGVVGHSSNGAITSCNNSGTAKCYGTESITYGTTTESKGIVGGILGWASGATITGCKNNGSISGDWSSSTSGGIIAGGIVGWLNGSTVEKSCSYGNGTVSYQPTSSSDTSVRDCKMGGIVGLSTQNTIKQCWNSETVMSAEANTMISWRYHADNLGGIAGYATETTIENCYNIGTLRGNDYIGGIVGQLLIAPGYTNKSYIYNCFNASSDIDKTSGSTNVALMLGSVNNTDADYNSSTDNAVVGAYDATTCDFQHYQTITLQNMQTVDAQTNTSALLTLMSNGRGAGLWAQTNGSLPYLINNPPVE